MSSGAFQTPQFRALRHVAELASGPPVDPEALVLDPCYQGTTVEAAALRLGCPVEWHPGFRLGVEELRLHPDYRGQEYVDLGTQIAIDGILDPRILGDAARTGHYAPQAVKKVWHYLARFGASWKAADESVSPAPVERAVRS